MNAGLRDVARAAGVSPGTVSNYFNHPEKVARSTATRIQKAIKSLGYVGNGAASTMRRGLSKTLAHIALEANNPALFDVSESAENRANEAGYSMVLANSGGSFKRQAAHLDLFESQRVSGIMITPLGDITERIRTLQARGISVLVVGQPANPDVCSSVFVDDLAGGRLAAEHLIERGSRRLLFVGGPLDLVPIEQRLDGARIAADKAGASLDVLAVPERTIAQGRSVAMDVFADGAVPFDGIFAANDLLAIGILHGCLSAGVRVPEDVAIVGFDDIDFARDALIPLTSVRRPAAALGATAVDILVREINSRRQNTPAPEFTNFTFRPELVVRDSTSGVRVH